MEPILSSDWQRRRRHIFALAFLAKVSSLGSALWVFAQFISVIESASIAPLVFAGAVISLVLLQLLSFFRAVGKTQSVIVAYLIISFLLFLVCRLTLPFFPGPTIYVLFVAVEVIAWCGLSNNYALLDEFLSFDQWLEMGPTLTWVSLAGSVVGSLTSMLIFTGFTLRAVLLVFAALYLLQVVIFLSLCRYRQRGSVLTAIDRSRPFSWGLHTHFLKALGSRMSLVVLGITMAMVVAMLRTELHVWSLSTFANVVEWVMGEYVVLFGLLGLGSAVLALIGAVAIRFVVTTWGVPAANWLYPLMLLVVLGLWMIFPASLFPAMIAMIVYRDVRVVVFGLQIRYNYAILPRRFIGEAMFATFGPWGVVGAVVGGALTTFVIGPNAQISLMGVAVGCGVLALVCGVLVGPRYKRNWLESLKLRMWDWEGESPVQGSLPRGTDDQIVKMLGEDKLYPQELGIYLATHSDRPDFFLEQVIPLIENSAVSRSRFRKYLASIERETLDTLLDHPSMAVRASAVSVVVEQKLAIPVDKLTSLLRDDSDWVRVLSCGAGWQLGLSELASVTWDQVSAGPMRHTALIEFLDVAEGTDNPHILKIIKKLAWFPSPTVRAKAMVVLGKTLRGRSQGDVDLLETGLRGMQSGEAKIRQAAVTLLIASGADNAAEHLATLFADPSSSVRLAAAKGLAQMGKRGEQIGEMCLLGPTEDVISAALQSLVLSGKTGIKAANKARLRWARRVVATQSLIPRAEEEGLLYLKVIIRDYRTRFFRRAEMVLAAMGYREAAAGVGRLESMTKQDEMEVVFRALRGSAPKAVVEPVILAATGSQAEEMTLEAMYNTADPWLKAASLLTCHLIGRPMPGPNAKEVGVASLLRTKITQNQGEQFMHRLLFLGNIPFFEQLTLEELLVLDKSLTQEELVEGETIFKEGEIGDRFYLVFQGAVGIYKGDKKIAQLTSGDHFAEMSLFDEAPRSATAIADERTTLLSLDKERFHALMLERPEILFGICRELSRRLRAMSSN